MEKAKIDRRHIRPMLFQIQPKNQEVTVAALREHLMTAEQIPEERIAVVTGDQRELNETGYQN
uniref:Uncharacterized protein n=1 Tax=Candidatus Kentrum sp. TUN TaxID=2126343 RepID=A0A450ZCJ7_9GAMM|nr:MAG: hypothetical protein BECKTUN1418D_GA0071000_100826 [Candidatus Kentron sp. TUN]